MVVVAVAFDLTGDANTATACCEGMDYIFGRNALNQSYVTGYGDGLLAEPAQPLVRPPARPPAAQPARGHAGRRTQLRLDDPGPGRPSHS